MQDKYACKANDGIVTEGLMSDTLWSTSLTGKPRLLTPTRTQNDEVSPLKRKKKNHGVIGCLSVVPDGS